MSKTKQIENPAIELDGLTNALRIATEKIDIITDEISGEFFDSFSADSSDIKYFFDSNRIRMDIVRDYAVEARKTAGELREVANVIFDILKNIEVTANA